MNNEDNKSFANILMAIIALASSIVAIFKMYYIFATIALILGLIGLRKESSRGMSKTTLVIVFITLIIKVLEIVSSNDWLPEWLMKGL